MKNFLIQFAQKIDHNEVGVPALTGDEVLQNGLNIVYFAAGIMAVVIIIIAGIKYASSTGDITKITIAKNMLLYAIIGLGVVLSAFAITNFIMGGLS